METEQIQPLEKNTVSRNTIGACCESTNDGGACCTPSKNEQDNGGACCAQPADGSACCNK